MKAEETSSDLFGEKPYRTLVESIKDYAIFHLDCEGRVLSWNEGARHLFGYEASEIIGESFSRLFTPEDKAGGIPERELENAREAGRVEDVRWHSRRDGSRFYADGVTTALRGEAGVLRGFAKVAHDATVRKQMEDARSLMVSVADASQDAIFGFDSEGGILTWSHGAEKIFGYSADEAVGMSLTALVPPERRHELGTFLDMIKRGEYVTQFETVRQRKDGTRFDASLTMSPAKNAVGEIILGSAIVQDVTTQKTAADMLLRRVRQAALGRDVGVALAESDTLPVMLRRCVEAVVSHLDAAFARVWTLDEAEAVLELRASAGMYTHTDGAHGRVPVGKFKIGMIAAERKPHLTNAVIGDERVADQAWAEREGMIAFAGYPLVVENRLVGVMAMFSRAPLAEDTLDALASISNSIALGVERKRAEEALRANQERLILAQQAGRAGTFEWDIQKDVILWSPELEAIYGIPPGTYEGDFASWSKRVVPEDARTVEEGLRVALKSRHDEYGYEFRAVLPDGAHRWLAGRARLEYDAGGQPLRLIGINFDITERKLAEVHDQFLLGLDETVRQQTDADEIVATCARLLGEHLRADRCAYAEVEADEDHFHLTGDYTSGDDVLSIVGYYSMTQFGAETLRLMRAGEPYVVADAERDERVTPADLASYRQTQIRAVVCVPLHKAGRFVAAMAVHQKIPRTWTNAEVELVTTVTGRCWESIERARAVRSLRESEQRYRTLFASIDEGFCVIEMLFDEKGKPVDYRFVEFNPSFEKLTGIPMDEALSGKTVLQILPNLEMHWFETYGRVALTGEPIRFISESGAMNRWFDVYAFRVEGAQSRKVAILFNNITERKRAESDRERLIAELREADRLKDEFLAMLSHELRTPMTAILGWSQLIRTHKFDDAGFSRALDVIERNARAQTQLIDDLLDVSRVITGKLRLDMRSVELQTVINSAVDAVRPAAEAKSIRLQMLLDPQTGTISGDPDRLQQIVWNLLTNAVKFTPRDGRVQVRLERVNSHVEIVISDTGRGIPPEFLPHVFDRFRQADQTTTRTIGGLGLGLAIVRQLVELHGGTITALSDGTDCGATFTVSLPLLPLRVPAHETLERAHSTAHTSTPIGCWAELDGIHVLIVDDEEDTREMLAFVLSECGAQVTTASSAREALAKITDAQPHVIISDIGMPNEDGYSLIKQIRALPPERGGAIPAVALTAYARPEDRVRALRSGFQMHVPKPVENAEVVAVVANLTGRVVK